MKGYKYLIENVGVFEINTAMIGYTAEGEARVWCNENYSLNYPQLRKNYVIGVSAKNDAENVSGEELFIMKEIACAIEEKC